MRKCALITALILLSSVFALAQSGGDQTPPGGDMVGSDYHAAEGQLGEQSRDAAQNQRMSGTYGNTKGYAGNPSYAGSSEYSSTQAQSATGATGQQGETAAIAGRARAEDRQSSPYDTRASQPYLSGAYGQNNGQNSRPQPATRTQANRGQRNQPPK
jgi:hypothetical protein